MAAPVASPFLSQLLQLSLFAREQRTEPSYSAWSTVLSHFTNPPYAQLRSIFLYGDGVTAQHALSLACLPRLFYLRACEYHSRTNKELGEAHSGRGSSCRAG